MSEAGDGGHGPGFVGGVEEEDTGVCGPEEALIR